MAPNPIAAAMVQNATLGAFSNILAQVITAFKTGTDVTIDWVPVFQFVLFNLISTPPNFLWQDFLESAFPAYPKNQQPSSKTKKEKDQAEPTPPKLSIRNTIIKFILDQTIGAVLNTLLFSTFTHSIRLATSPTQRITSLPKAISYWMSPGSVDFGRVNWSLVWELSLDEFWSIFVAGWKLWPAVSVVNFTLVKTVEGRNLVGSLAGVVWGVYMSLISAQ